MAKISSVGAGGQVIPLEDQEFPALVGGKVEIPAVGAEGVGAVGASPVCSVISRGRRRPEVGHQEIGVVGGVDSGPDDPAAVRGDSKHRYPSSFRKTRVFSRVATSHWNRSKKRGSRWLFWVKKDFRSGWNPANSSLVFSPSVRSRTVAVSIAQEQMVVFAAVLVAGEEDAARREAYRPRRKWSPRLR